MKGITYILAGVIALLGIVGVAEAARGISVSPSEIMADSITEWPHVESVAITNTGLETEWVEITIPGNEAGEVYVEPSRFPLAEGEIARVLVTFYKPEVKTVGKLEITGTRKSADGLETGTGIEVPYVVSKTALTQGDMRAAVLAGTGDRVGGLMSTFMWMLFLSGLVLATIIVARRINRRI